MKCEVCGCDHDGSYGSGRFCSYECKQANNGKNKTEKWLRSMAISHRKLAKLEGWKCDFCGSIFETKEILIRHKKSHGSKCKFCGKVFENRRQLGGHTRLCRHNPNYSVNYSHQLKLIEALKVGGTSDETKKKISDSMKRFYEEHQESASYKYNHYTKGSWAEDYFRDLFTKEGITGWEQQFHVSRYRLDFAFVDKKIDFEVDGHQHYVDKRIIEHDKVRTANLEASGWKVIRIRWSSWNAMTLEQKRQWLDDNLYRFVK